MEHIQINNETQKLNVLGATIEQIAAAKEETKIQKAKRLADSVARAAKELDSCVERVGLFFNITC